jgi:aspartyl/asparaginyl-tRNA synthetase
MLNLLKGPISKRSFSSCSYPYGKGTMWDPTTAKKNGFINALEMHNLINKLRNFFNKKGYIEVHAQYRRSILAACEDPWTIRHFDFGRERWPLPQTGQMWLEYDLLTNPEFPGVFTVSTSYRDEPNPIEGRHQTIFPMFEFEGHGNFQDMIQLEKELLEDLFFGTRDQFTELDYEKACLELGVPDIEAEQEAILCEKAPKNIVFLEMFPERSSPFWNMARTKHPYYNGEQLDFGQYAKKVDVLIHGHETIGSAERDTDSQRMRENFEATSDGAYASKIRELFGEERVNNELDDFLSLDLFERFGGGIGIHRLINALKKIEPKREPFCHLP